MARPKNCSKGHPVTQCTCGRPTVMTPEVIRKLEEVFSIGGSDKEACFYADISMTALYEYQERNPLFTQRKHALKEKPNLKARQTIVKALDQPEYALKYLERKKKDEFSLRQELTGAEGAAVGVVFLPNKPDGLESSK